jgi:hypothetical protein
MMMPAVSGQAPTFTPSVSRASSKAPLFTRPERAVYCIEGRADDATTAGWLFPIAAAIHDVVCRHAARVSDDN